jgi:hypothetical protein
VPGRVNGFSLAYTATGAVVLWSGIRGWSLSATAKSLLSGATPAGSTEPINTTSVEQSAAAAGGTAAGGSAAPGNTGAANAGAAANQANAKLQAAAYGWSTGQQWADLVSLWNQESGWSNTAQNPTSTAYGIAQFLDSTWGPYGAKTSSATLQIRYGLEYIKNRYGSPSAAWAHEVANGWY